MSHTRILVNLQQWWQQRKQNKRIVPLDINLFLRQFTTLLTAGVPLIQSCELLEKSQEKTAMRLLLYTIKRELLSGKSLYHSLRPHTLYFNDFTCQLIHLGEQTGQLDILLNNLVTHREKMYALQTQLRQALFYPGIISFTALLVCGCLFCFVIPHFAELFQHTHTALPRLTVWIFTLSAILQHYFIFCLLGLGIGIGLLTHYSNTTMLKQYLGQLPILQNCLRKIHLARFTRSLALTFTAGIPIPQAMQLSTPPSAELTKAVLFVCHKVRAGMQLHQAMCTITLFPPLMVQMIKVGEESGMLAEMLDKIAQFFELEADKLLIQSSRLLEPLIILVLGVLIGVIVIGMYLPIFNLGNAFS